jgi:hypothetical protein
MPLPQLAWDFQSSNVDYVTGLSPTTSVGPPTYNSAGKYGSSVVFNNTPGATPGTYYLTYTTGISLSTASGFTVCAWIKPLAVGVSGNQTFLSIAGQNTFFILQIDSSATNIHLYGQNPFTVPNQINGSAFSVTQSTWIHAVMVFSGTSITTYYNGTLKDSLSLVVSPVTFNALGLGNRSAINADSAANGELDDLRIFDRALTSAQVQSIYNQQGVPGRGVHKKAAQPLLFGSATILYGDAPTGNTAVSFDGTSGCYMTFGSDTPTNINQTTSNIFVEAWVYFNDLNLNNRIFTRTPFVSSTAGSADIVFRTAGVPSNILYFNYGSGGYTGGANVAGLVQGTWCHVAMSSVKNNGISYVFLNGVPGAGKAPPAGTYTATSNTFISAGASNEFSNMYIRDLRVIKDGIIPTTSFTPQAATWAYGSMPSYVTGGTNVLGLAAQYMTPTLMTGTSLFQQLSVSATGSAVGAFSLRAVNGTSARALQITPSVVFPPAAFTNPTGSGKGPYTQTLTGYSFGGTGTYTANASSGSNTVYACWKAFDRATQVNGYEWLCAPSCYDTSTNGGNYLGSNSTTIDGISYLGEWLEIKFPLAVSIQSYSYSVYSGFGPARPRTFKLAGSNDGTSWATLDTRTNYTGLTGSFTLSTPGPVYQYLRMAVSNVQGTTTSYYVCIQELSFQVSNASWATDFYADRLGNLLTAPVTGQSLVNWQAQASSNMTPYVTTWYDQSGQGRHATGTLATLTQTSNVNQQWAVNPTNGGLSLSGGAFLNGTDFTIACTTKRLGTQGNDGVYGYGANASWVAQASVATTYGDNTRFALVMPNAGSTAVAFNDSSYSAAFSSNANVLPSTFVGATEPTVYTAVTLTGATQRMYINGTANGLPISALTQVTANASTGFTIGTVNYYGSFLGEIGELLIFNNALAAADISSLYSAR